MKATELYEAALALNPKCTDLNKSCSAELSCGTVYYAVQGAVLTFESVDEILKCGHSNESY